MDADCLPFDQHRFESLNAETVKRRSTVQEHRVLANHVLKDIPHDRFLRLYQLFRLLNRGAMARGFELVIDERLEKLQRHLLRQTALMQLQLRSDHDNGTAGVVDALAQQVLAQTALFALERVGKRLERAIVRSAQDSSATPVVKQRVHSL